MDRQYEITRREDGTIGCVVYWPRKIEPGAACMALDHVVHHSPTGFEAGYQGSGPADLALSIMAHYYGVNHAIMQEYMKTGRAAQREDCERVCHVYQRFKQDFIAPIQIGPGQSWLIDGSAILGWLVKSDLPVPNESV